MLETVTQIALITVALSAGLCAFRIWRGPSGLDRRAALQLLILNILGLVFLLSMDQSTRIYLPATLGLGILGWRAAL